MSVVLDANSAYVILVNDDNTMTTTQKRRVMQRSKLVDSMCFLVQPIYSGYNMADFTVSLEYILPTSKRYCNEILTLSEDMYNGHLKYELPFDTNLTYEPGDIELALTFLLADLDEFGNSVQRVRKVSGTRITITPSSAWSDIIPDSALSALDQRIIKTDAQIKALEDMNATLYETLENGLPVVDFGNNSAVTTPEDEPNVILF